MLKNLIYLNYLKICSDNFTQDILILIDEFSSFLTNRVIKYFSTESSISSICHQN